MDLLFSVTLVVLFILLINETLIIVGLLIKFAFQLAWLCILVIVAMIRAIVVIVENCRKFPPPKRVWVTQWDRLRREQECLNAVRNAIEHGDGSSRHLDAENF